MTTSNFDNSYDAILIGSGIGAVTVAVGLERQKGWRCLTILCPDCHDVRRYE